MKNNRKAVEERQIQILAEVRRREEITVEELAERYQTSLMTIRRDLQTLEEQKLLKRVHGGAISLDRASRYASDNKNIARCRARISEYAAGYVSDGDALFINGSRTALDIMRYLRARNVSVFTNNGWAIGMNLPASISLHITGGEPRDHVFIGEYVMRNLLNMRANKTFLGCAAVYDDGEFRYDIPMEIGINEAMISRTEGGLFILADHTKLCRRSVHENSYGSCSYDRPVTLITDELANPAMVEKLQKQGMEVIQVPLNEDRSGARA